MKKLIVGISMFALLALAFPLQAADTAGVSATVTVKNIAVSVDTPNVSYGTLAIDTESSPTVAIIVTNDGNVDEDFDIKGSNSTNWTLSNTANGNEIFMHRFATDDDSFVAYTALNNTTYDSLDTGVTATTGTQEFKLKILTPDTTTNFSEQTTTVTVLATETTP